MQNLGRGGGGTRCAMVHVKMVNSSILYKVNITYYNCRVMTCAQYTGSPGFLLGVLGFLLLLIAPCALQRRFFDFSVETITACMCRRAGHRPNFTFKLNFVL